MRVFRQAGSLKGLSTILTGVVAVVAIAAASVANATIVDPVGYWDFETDLQNQVTLSTALEAQVIGGDPEPGWSGGVVTRSDGTSTRPGGQVGNGVNIVDADNDRLRLPFGTSNLGNSFAISIRW